MSNVRIICHIVIGKTFCLKQLTVVMVEFFASDNEEESFTLKHSK